MTISTKHVESAYFRLVGAGRLPLVPPSAAELKLSLDNAPPTHRDDVKSIREFLSLNGSKALRAVIDEAAKSPPAWLAASRFVDLKALKHESPLQNLPSFAAMEGAFASPLPPRFPIGTECNAFLKGLDDWNRSATSLFVALSKAPVHEQIAAFGGFMLRANTLLASSSSARMVDELNSTSKEVRDVFEEARGAFLSRYDAAHTVVADGLLASDLETFEERPVGAMVRNFRNLGKLFGDTSFLCSSLGFGGARLAIEERGTVAGILGQSLKDAGVTLRWPADKQNMARVNTPEMTFITRRHVGVLNHTIDVLADHGVTGERATKLLNAALEYGQRSSSKPWQGLRFMIDLIEHAKLDPAADDFLDKLADRANAPVLFTHKPGQEYIVRDPTVVQYLLAKDGQHPRGANRAPLEQGQSSLLLGVLRPNDSLTNFARKHSPVTGFFGRSMVSADGATHTKLRKPFLPFFTARSVIEDHNIEGIVKRLLDDAQAKAAAGGGKFEFTEFAAELPLQTICDMVGIPPDQRQFVQELFLESVRSIDVIGGKPTPGKFNRGQLAGKKQGAFLQAMLNDVRAGKPSTPMLKALVADPALNDEDRVANLGVVIFAGFETTAGLLSKGLVELMNRREQWEHLTANILQEAPPIHVGSTAVSDHDLRWYAWAETSKRDVNGERKGQLEKLLQQSEPLRERFELVKKNEAMLTAAVQEMVRYTAPGALIPLTASTDVSVPVHSEMEIGGVSYHPGESFTVRKGETLHVAVDEANRRCPFGYGQFDKDGSVDFDVTRDPNYQHFSFGIAHNCIGADLAFEEARRAVEGVLRRFPDLQLAGLPIEQELELFSGMESVPVRSDSARKPPLPE